MSAIIIVVVLVVVVAVIGYVAFGRRGDGVPVAPPRYDDFEEGVVSEPVPVSPAASVNGVVRDNRADEVAADVVEPGVREPQIRWTKQFEPRSGSLSDEARLRLINDLGMLRARWCVPLLVQADQEETDPAHRVAVQLALAHCRDESLPLGRITPLEQH